MGSYRVRAPHRQVIRPLVIAVLIVSGMMYGQAASALAHTNCGAADGVYRWYATGVKKSVTAYGGYYEAHEQNYIVYNAGAGGWVVQRLLVASASTPGWVEVGYGWGWRGSNIPHFYVGRNDNNNNYSDWKLSKFAPNPADINTWHSYLIETTPDSSTNWTVKIDYTTWASFSPSTVAKPSNWIEVGGESNQRNSTMHITYARVQQYRKSDLLWYTFGDVSSTICYEDSPFHYEWLTRGQESRFWGP